MRITLLISFLFISLFATSQTILDTTFAGWKAKVFLPANWDGNADSSRQCIVFSYGAGQAGTVAYDSLDNYGPIGYLVGGWNGGVTLGNGTHYPVIIGLQQNPAFSYTGQALAKINAIKARYKIKASNLHVSGWSAGGHLYKAHIIEDGIGGSAPFTYASGFKSIVDMQGVVPDEDATWFTKVRNFALNGVSGGGKYLGIWGTGDGSRSIPRFADSMNAAVSNSAFVVSNSDSHNSAAVDRIFGTVAGTAPQNITIGGVSQNVYQWMLRQGDTTLAASPVASAGADTTVYINQTRPDSVYLNGSASTGATTYSWTFLSGTNTPTILSSSSQSTWVTGLVEGSYTFRLTVNGTVTDDVNVFVRDFMNKGQRPCRAGTKQSFVLTQSGGEVYRPYITRDNNLPSLLGGDTIYIQGGTFTGGVELGDFGGSPGCPIVIAAKDEPVVITNGGFFRFGARDSNMVSYVKIDGTTLRGAGYPYGFVSSHATFNSDGLTINLIHHAEITGVSIRKKNVGILLKKASAIYPFTHYDKFIIRNVKIYDNYIRDIEGEGMYIGHTSPSNTDPGNSSIYGPPARMDSFEIYNNIVDSTGWDGIQISNATNYLKVYNNFVHRTGQSNIGGQQHSIIIGSNINAPQVYKNTIITGTGGFGVFSYGSANIYDNVVYGVASTGGEEGLYIQQNPVLPETITPLVPTVTNNIITGANTHAVFTASTPNTSGGTITGNYFLNNGTNGVANNSGATVSGNTTTGTFTVAVNSVTQTSTGYSINITANGTTASFTSTLALNTWLFERLTGVSSFRDNRIRIRKMRFRINN